MIFFKKLNENIVLISDPIGNFNREDETQKELKEYTIAERA